VNISFRIAGANLRKEFDNNKKKAFFNPVFLALLASVMHSWRRNKCEYLVVTVILRTFATQSKQI
jgi:hypothetical protein